MGACNRLLRPTVLAAGIRWMQFVHVLTPQLLSSRVPSVDDWNCFLDLLRGDRPSGEMSPVKGRACGALCSLGRVGGATVVCF